MEISQIQEIAIGVLAVLGSALTSGWVAKMLIQRLLNENTDKHKETSKTLKELSDNLTEIKESIAVFAHVLKDLEQLKLDARSDREKLIYLEVHNEKFSKDLKNQFDVVKDINRRFEDFSKLISDLRGSIDGKTRC